MKNNKYIYFFILLISLLALIGSINAQNNTDSRSIDTIALSNKELSVEIAVKGAEIISIFNKKDKIEYIWQGSRDSWARHSPVLFPFVGKIKGGYYKVDGKKYKMKLHGFASHSVFKVMEHTPSKAVLLLESDSSTLKIYPFKFRLIVSYVLEGKELKVVNTVENIDTKEIYFSIGAHPGFNVPVGFDGRFEDYIVEFDKREVADRIVLSETNGLPTGSLQHYYLKSGNILPLDHKLFRNRVIILKGIKSESLMIRKKDSKSGIKIKGVGKFPYLGIWSYPKKAEPFICIEPWYGISDFINSSGEIKEKTGIQALAPDGSFMMYYSIEIIN